MVNASEVGKRIQMVREILGMKQAGFGGPAYIKQGYISEVERGLKSLSDARLKLLCLCHGIRMEFIKNGSGEIFETAARKEEPAQGETDELRELIAKAKTVLRSETHYARSLASNIESFHHGLEAERGAGCVDLDPPHGDVKIRNGDSPEKMDELLRLRAR